jgi:aspartate--ammonia ligase
MNKIFIPEGYKPSLSSYDTQLAIEFIKHGFQKALSRALTLKRVSAPLFVVGSSGLNDNLSGSERPVSFDVPAVKTDAEVVHSLAKWKRLALKKYGFSLHEGLVTDMNAIRRDEELDNIHSVYVDQWDWEKVIEAEDRNLEYLKDTVRKIVSAICDVSDALKAQFPALDCDICREVTFITAQELEDLYPNLSPSERETALVKEKKTVFVMQIGAPLKSGEVHSKRAPDYDDWTLNGDLLLYNEVLDSALEISSMGIRVDKKALDSQLKAANCDYRRELPFHQMLLNDELPLTIGGGIGQSRLCMLLMGRAHIGEVQSGIWDAETVKVCEEKGVPLL